MTAKLTTPPAAPAFPGARGPRPAHAGQTTTGTRPAGRASQRQLPLPTSLPGQRQAKDTVRTSQRQLPLPTSRPVRPNRAVPDTVRISTRPDRPTSLPSSAESRDGHGFTIRPQARTTTANLFAARDARRANARDVRREAERRLVNTRVDIYRNRLAEEHKAHRLAHRTTVEAIGKLLEARHEIQENRMRSLNEGVEATLRTIEASHDAVRTGIDRLQARRANLKGKQEELQDFLERHEEEMARKKTMAQVADLKARIKRLEECEPRPSRLPRLVRRPPVARPLPDQPTPVSPIPTLSHCSSSSTTSTSSSANGSLADLLAGRITFPKPPGTRPLPDQPTPVSPIPTMSHCSSSSTTSTSTVLSGSLADLLEGRFSYRELCAPPTQRISKVPTGEVRMHRTRRRASRADHW